MKDRYERYIAWYDHYLRGGKASAASPDDKPSPELAALLQDGKASMAFWITFAAVVLIVADMVIKPFS